MVNKFRPVLSLVLFYTAAALALTMLLVFVYSALTGFQAPAFFRTLSNILFFEGMLAVTFGAFVEFFVKGRSSSVLRSMEVVYDAFSKVFGLAWKDLDVASIGEGSSGGCALIAIGALIVIVSAAFAFASM